MKRKLKGFSLVEIIIVITIISFILLIVQLSVSPKGLHTLNATTQKLKSDIQYIQKKSIYENCYHKIVFDLRKNEYRLLKDEDGKGYVTFEVIPLPKGISFRTTMQNKYLAKNPLIYTFKGTPGQTGTVELESTIDINYKVDVSIVPVSGKVNIKDIVK